MPVKRFGSGKYVALASATGLLLLNFWAWSLLSPLASKYASEFNLSPFALSALIAMPVIVGSLGRIPLGLLTDRFGGRRMFIAVCIFASIPTAFFAVALNYTELLAAAFCLGIAGASFAVGVPFVSAWFPRQKRGFALGLYGVGNAGTALSGFLTPRLHDTAGKPATFLFVAALLLLAGTLMLWSKDAPAWKPARAPAVARLAEAMHWRPTKWLALLYAVTFGAFIAFGLYLPILLNANYSLEPTDAAARAAGFVLLATLARPVGGWLSDHIGGTIVLRFALGSVAVLACIVASSPTLMPLGTIAYLLIAALLGAGNGAIFTLIGRLSNEKRVGAVTGIVGAAGGIGGFFPPLVLGASFQSFHSYTLALLLFAAASVVILPATYKLGATSR